MDWKPRVRAAFAASAPIPDEDVLEELAQHAAAMYDCARAEGCSREESEQRVAAQIDCWRRDAAALHHKQPRKPAVEPPPAAGPAHLVGLAHDFRYAVRLLVRQPRFAVVAAATIAIGIAATTTLFSVTYGVLMKPLPWAGADRLVVLEETRGGKPPRFGAFTNATYLAWREKMTTVEDLAAWSPGRVTMTGAGGPDRIQVAQATASLFALLRARPLVGSLYTEHDETAPVVVLSERLWRERFGADPAAIGRLIRLNGNAHTIVGVLPGELAYPDRDTLAWLPFRVQPAAGNYLSLFNALARVRAGATPAQVAAEGTARGGFTPDTGMTTMAIFGGRGPVAVSARPLREALTADVRLPLLVLLAAVSLLLATATANVANLQLARATTRRREMAIRAALGAGTMRVTRQLLVESLLLAFAGGAAGIGLAWLLHRALPSLLPADFPRTGDLALTTPILVFAVALSTMTGLAFGVLPAWRARRVNLVELLAEDGTAPVGGRGRSHTARIRLVIIGAQVAIACILLVGASLLGRSFVSLVRADRGYDPSGVLTAQLSFPSTLYAPERRYTIARTILERLRATGGVARAGFTSEMPLSRGGSTAAFTMRSPRAEGGTVSVQVSPRIVSDGYLEAIGMRLVSGRGFLESDTETSRPVVVVNRAFASRYLAGSALGMTVPITAYQGDEAPEGTIVGVVDDVKEVTAANALRPEMYFSYRQMKGRLVVPVITFVVRTAGDPAALGPTLRAVMHDADSDLVPDAVVTLEDRMMRGLARPRLYAVLLAGFAGFALVVAAVGLVGVLSYMVAQRSRELAVRTALGAQRTDILALVLRQGLAVTGAGLVVGIAGAFALTRWIASLLYGVNPHDVTTYVAVPALLAIVAAAACLGPALRAARLDPLTVLKRGQ